MTDMDVYLLALHEPYREAEFPAPINATIVHARTLLHPGLPQPDGALMYRCLTEFPGRSPGCVVPVSTLTHELNGGLGWGQIGDWLAVINAVIQLSRQRGCDAMPLGLPETAAALLVNGPTTKVTVSTAGGLPTLLDPAQRQQHLDHLSAAAAELAAQAPFWPGDNLVDPPREPATMPYHPRS